MREEARKKSVFEIGEHQLRRVQQAQVTAEIPVFGRAAGDAFDVTVQAKPLSERKDQFFRKIVVKPAQNAVEFDAVHVDIVRVAGDGDVNKLQSVALAALRERALPVGMLHAVRFTEQRETEPQPFAAPAAENAGEFSEKSAYVHVIIVSRFDENVNTQTEIYPERVLPACFFFVILLQ